MHSRERVDAVPSVWDGLVGSEMFPGGLVIKDEEVEVFLYWGAQLRVVMECSIPECPECERADRLWWDWCNSLAGPNRIRLQRALRQRNIPLPPHPGDDVLVGS